MADVVTYIKSGQPVRNGSLVLYVTPLGVIYSKPGGPIGQETANQTYARIEASLSGRFDDPDYYST